MTLIALGINHKTAKLDVREKVAFSPEQLPIALQELIGLPALKEAALLSTCNRTELYLHINNEEVSEILTWLKEHKALNDEDILDCHYIHKNEQAVAHMMKVACGLDSMVLGESQVLGQLKQAFSIARSAGTIGTHLEQLFQHSFSVAKTVRTETDIGASAVSVAYASVTLAKQLFSSLENTTALFIGAGDTIELAAQHFTSQAKINTIFANRTRERASELAQRYNGEAISLSEIPNYLPKADIVISATASPLPILGKGLVESAIKQRKRKPIFMIDLAVPRDVEAEVRELPDIYLFDVDALQNIIQENMKGRENAAIEAKVIIDEQTQRFLDWRRSLDAVSTIRVFRDKYQDMADIELSRSLSRLEKGESAETLLRELTRRLTNKFLHEPTRQLNEAVSQGDTESLNRARNLFSLDNEPSKSNQDKQK
ncbi:MAG: glutamyl-tRNA reductase [Enterobacterales bacterium]|jgi:glutamyl-tRNA reductase